MISTVGMMICQRLAPKPTLDKGVVMTVTGFCRGGMCKKKRPSPAWR